MIKGFAFISSLLIFTVLFSSVGHLYKEKDYQKAWCEREHGIIEYVLDDQTRVDCLLPDYAVEFDFAPKWAESIGQSLYYGLKTNRQPGVVLILEHPDKDEKYLKRLNTVAMHYNIKVWTMTPYQL
ncbi:hypothetical protein JZK55_07640 [Dissulfurispira thermophila]|uniref:Uncharacterized protein n=1 Tax=Dissulfurispira thermophila TaxID=2715679 RepID=A0A7G1H0M7_9BACT|nr:hypothetical protein [Dissulfurispira thermophila]BCB95842.1 hypothetical protein JZK55_07640 [Dissulfurispira thermophila]